jgi:hypothetical protein
MCNSSLLRVCYDIMCRSNDQVRSVGKTQDLYSEDIRFDYREVHGHLNVVPSNVPHSFGTISGKAYQYAQTASIQTPIL